MSRAFRTAELLAAAGLAPMELQRQQLLGQQEAQNTAQWTNALSSGAKGVYDTLLSPTGALAQNAQADVEAAKQQAIADQGSTTGAHTQMTVPAQGPTEDGSELTRSVDDPNHFSATPADIAKQSLNPLDKLANSGSDWFGFRARALAAAKPAAQQAIATEVQGNRDKAQNLARQQQLDALNAQKTNAEIGAENAATTASAAQTEDVKTKGARDKAAFEKAQTDDAVKQAVAAGIARGDSLGWIRVKNPDLEDGDIATEYARQTGATANQNAGLDEKRAQTANLYAERDLKAAEAKAKTSAGQGKFASALSDIDSGVALVDDLKRRAQNVVGARQGISGTLQDVGSDMHGVTGALLKGVGRAAQTPDMAAFNTDLTNFVLHSSKALEGTHRSISEGQAKEIRDRLLADAHSGDLNSLNAELDALRAAMVAERANIGRTGIATPTGDAGSSSSTLPNPFR